MDSSGSRAPVVLIVPGSGPTDRDGNSPLGVRASTYRLLAQNLAEQGVTVARIDKRGLYSSSQAVIDANDVTMADYAQDIHSWVNVLREQTGALCVWVLGHSEGGLAALVAAQRGAVEKASICGLMLVATPGRPMGQLLRAQLQAHPANAPILEQAEAAIAELEAGRRVDVRALNPALRPLFHPRLQGFLIATLTLDPVQYMAGVDRPVLVLQGTRDLQVPMGDAEMLARSAPQAVLVRLADTNHVLKQVSSDDVHENLATYGDAQRPLAPGVVDSVLRFLAMPGPSR
ncbi:alpha/beta fold hydrolase [Comamonadaceae bacterium PP-2]